MAFSIEDVNSRTILQQFHALYKNQEETNAKVEDVESDLDQEIQDRTNADIGLSEQIQDLQDQLDSLGTIFTLKGSVATVADLPESNNHVGDVWYVESVSTGYIWIDDNGTERWEQLGISVDLSNYVTNSDLETELSDYQEKLTAGTNISIIDNVISASGGTMPHLYLHTIELNIVLAGSINYIYLYIYNNVDTQYDETGLLAYLLGIGFTVGGNQFISCNQIEYTSSDKTKLVFFTRIQMGSEHLKAFGYPYTYTIDNGAIVISKGSLQTKNLIFSSDTVTQIF